VQAIIELERAAAEHWRGTEQQWLGEWLLRAAEGFTGRANSALPLGDPGLPLDDALAAVTGWYRARGLPPMVAVPMPLEGPAVAEVPPSCRFPSRLDDHLSERSWATRPGPAYVMTAELAALPPAPGLPAGAEFRVDAEPDDAWLAIYHYRGRQRGCMSASASATRTAATTASHRVSDDTPGCRMFRLRAGFWLRLSSWPPVRPRARLARAAGRPTPSATSSPTTSRLRWYSLPRRPADGPRDEPVLGGRAVPHAAARGAGGVPRAAPRGQAAARRPGPATRAEPVAAGAEAPVVRGKKEAGPAAEGSGAQ
jgi:hypothetical protein